MNWELHTNGFELEREMRDEIERRLTFALSRFGTSVSKAVVYLTDQNGPKGGADKFCQVVVRLRGLGEVIAKVIDVDWRIGIDRLTTRIGHNVGRTLKRKREFVRKPHGDS